MAAFTNNSQSSTNYSPTGHDNSVSKSANDRDSGFGDNKRDNGQTGPVESFDAYSTQNSGFASKPRQHDDQLGGIGSYETTSLGGNTNNPFESVGLDGQAKGRFGQRAGETDKGSQESYGQRSGGFGAGSEEVYGQGGIDAGSKDVYSHKAGGVDSGLSETHEQKSHRIDAVLGARGIGATLFGDSPATNNDSRGQRMGEIDPGSAETRENRSDGVDANSYTRVATVTGDSTIDSRNKAGVPVEASKSYQPSQLGLASTGPRNDTVSGGAAFGGLSDQVNPPDDHKSHNPERKGAEFKNTPTHDTVSHDDHSGTNQKPGVSFDPTSRHEARNEADGPSPPSFGDKVKGKLEVTAGKISGNDKMIERGRDRQTADSNTSA